MLNRLANETSPYLLQHAGNPVNWYAWGEEALQKARDEDKPIFLSIGYSACHWCHVMAHESFEDQGTAAILNEHFVNIKVDREERPDLDQIYMTAVQAMTGGGGWPMSVFLTPEGIPFYGGTYFPPAPRYGMPSFTQVLQAIVDAWQNRRQELVRGGQRLVETIEQQNQPTSGFRRRRELDRDVLYSAFRALQQQFDQAHGGWGGAPKFPQPMALEFLLRYHHSTGNTHALEMVTRTLEAMARGGMYDQVGGGFHRYSVDDHWLVPHFEKMLYDQSQLARVYLHAWQVTGNEFFRTITEEILDYGMREMTDPAGGFYSTQDADSEGEEGKFFLWTPDEIREMLGDAAEPFLLAYGVTDTGNFEGKNILEYKALLAEREKFIDDRQKLFQARQRRVPPGRDEKVLTSWNGLMLAAFAEAAAALGREDYAHVAVQNADFLLHHLMTDEGRLLHTWKAGGRLEKDPGDSDHLETQAEGPGFLEDYACLIEGLLALYQVEFDARWYQAAHDLAETMITYFRAPDAGFYDTADDHEDLIVRPRDLQDNATPSGNAMAATALLKLAGLAVELRYVDIAHQALAQMQPMMNQYPLGFGQWLQAVAYALSKPQEIAIVGEPDSADTQALLSVVRDGYQPFQIVALGAPDGGNATDGVGGISGVPFLQDRGLVEGHAVAYVCRDFACQTPVTKEEALRAQLESQ